MPPLRTVPPAKPVKTERTHEENQERAYIAASRRSDRSLEARVESARRASEIHKRRTGRSLRVTEADVINEEMYEEEDDDLPAQIRRITAHLHTGNDPFNRRLQAYLANHIAMRSALGQAVADNWQQQQMQNNALSQFVNPGVMQQQQMQQHQQPQQQMQQMQQQQQQQSFQNNMLPPQSTASRVPAVFRHSPYPTNPPLSFVSNNPQTVRQSPHSFSARSNDVDTKDRRSSLPPQSHMPHTPQSTHNSPTLSRTGSSASLSQSMPHPSTNFSPRPQSGVQQAPQPRFSPSTASSHPLNFAPFSPTLPMESQQLLAGAPSADLNDPAMAAMMGNPFVQSPGGNFKPSPGFYSYNPNGFKPKGNSPSSASQNNSNIGMNATLAPGMLDTSNAPSYTTPDSATSESFVSPFTPAGFGFGFDNNSFGDAMSLKDFDTIPNLDAAGSSGQVTPGEADWNLWLESQALGDETSTV